MDKESVIYVYIRNYLAVKKDEIVSVVGKLLDLEINAQKDKITYFFSHMQTLGLKHTHTI
jgi:hypothetical protein